MSSTQDPTQYIVKLKDHVDLDEHIQLFDDAHNGPNARHHNVTHKWSPEFTKAYVGEFSPEVLEFLEKHDNVEYISENSKMTAEDNYEITTQKNAGWGLSRINQEDKLPTTAKAKSVNYKYKYDSSYETGSGVDIYILDSGIYIDHNDFGGRAEWGYTVHKDATSDDLLGHGTHVAGIAGGKRWGVAKDAKLIAVKLGDDEGSFDVSDAVKGIEWILKRVKSSRRPSIVNMSHGKPIRNRFWNEHVTKLVKNGIHVVVAAGNKNWDARNTSPACALLVNTVGATNISDEKTRGSNYGPCVDFFAPGQAITSCYPYKDEEDKEDDEKDPDATDVKSGTSIAAPLVSGIIATIISLIGDRPPLMMTDILRKLCIRQGVVASSLPSNTTRALIQGALHVEANFRLKAQSGTLRLVNGTPDFDFSTIRSILMTSNNSTGWTATRKPPIFDKLKDNDSAFIKAKLETISTFSRGILSKVDEGDDVYKANVSKFDIDEIECKFNSGVSYDCTIPFMIVSAYPDIDVAVGHARKAEEDADGEATVAFHNTTYVNGSLEDYDNYAEEHHTQPLNEVVFKACLLRSINK